MSVSPRNEDRPAEGRGWRSATPALTVVGLTVAGLVHGFEAFAHLGVQGAGGHLLFFTVVAALQMAAAGALMFRRPSPALLAVGATDLGVAALWVASVTVGIPGVSDTPEPVSLSGLVATLGEALVVIAVVAEVAGKRVRGAAASPATRPAWGAAALAALLVAPLGAVALGAETHDHHGSGAHVHGIGDEPFDPGPGPGAADALIEGTQIPVDGRPGAVAVDGDTVWVASRSDGTARQWSHGGAPVGPAVAVGDEPAGMIVAGDFVWVANAGDGTVTRISRDTGEVVGSVDVGSVPVGLAVGFGSVWVANSGDGSVARLDPETGALEGHVGGRAETAYDRVTADGGERVGYGPISLAVGERSVWVVNSLEREVVRIDPLSDRVVGEPIAVPQGAIDVEVGHGLVWVASSTDGTVTRIDPAAGRRIGEPIVVDEVAQPGMGPAGLVVTEDAVWVVNNHDKTLIRLDPRTGEPDRPRFFADAVAERPRPMSVAATETGGLWLVAYDEGALVRFDT